MSEYSESAEQTVKMTLEGMDYFLRIVGNVSKETILAIHSIMENKTQTKGKTTLTNMVKSGEPVSIFSLPKNNIKNFATEAKKYGVVYVVVKDKADENGKIDIIVKDKDKAKIDRIIKKFVHDAPSKDEEQKLREKSAKSLEKKEKIEMAEKYLNGDIEQINPDLALIKGNQSKSSSKNQPNDKKPSVRAELKKYEKELNEKKKEKQQEKEQKAKRNNKEYKNSKNKNYHNKNKER